MRQIIYATVIAIIILLTSCQTKQDASKQTATGILVNKEAYKDITVEEAMKLHEQREVVFLDVRTPEETSEGIISGAIIADFRSDSFRQEVNALDKSKSYVVYCRSGGRSVKASNIMSEAGFSELMNMKGGYNAWKESNQ